MKTQFTPTFFLVLSAVLLSMGSVEAKNRHSLWGKVKSAFSSSSSRQTSHAAAARNVQNRPQKVQQAVYPPQVMAPPIPPRAPKRADRALVEMRRRADLIAKTGLRYKFGGASPSEGGMDCSGTMQHLIKGMGIRNIPRTSYDQYEWVKNSGNLRRRAWGSDESAYRNLKPGDLIFWGGTYSSGHKVSHVMLYLGQARDGRHFMFGAKSSRSSGLNGSGVDVFEMKPGKAGNLVGYGSVPGLRM